MKLKRADHSKNIWPYELKSEQGSKIHIMKHKEVFEIK